MNILDKLHSSFLDRRDDDGVLSPEEERAERKKFHRTQVRNGPVKFKQTTAGQVRRAEARAAKRLQKKAYKSQVREYFAKQRLASTLRGHLQAAGLLPYFGAHVATPEQAAYSVQWLVARFAPAPEDGSGVVEVNEELVKTALREALNTWETIVGLPKTKLRSDYTIPVALPA